MATVVLLLLALWAPVALLAGLARRADEPVLAPAERLALAAALALALVGWLSLVLATLGLFAGPTLLGGLVVAGLVATAWAFRQQVDADRYAAAAGRSGCAQPVDAGACVRGDALLSRGACPRHVQPARRSSAWLALRRHGELLVLMVLLAVAAGLYQPPFPYILGGLDPGVYVNTAAHIVHSGSLVWRDVDMVALPPDLRAVLFREVPRPLSHGSRYIGLYIADRDAGVVVPHGLHLYPAMMAALWWAGGLDVALGAGALGALAGLTTLYACARRLGGSLAATLAAAMLAGSIDQSWFARFPSAEPLAQAQVWAGLLALLVALRGGGRVLPLVGGALLGSAHLTKVELVVLPAVLALFLGWRWLAGRWTPALGWYLAGYAALAAHAALHAALIAPWYTLTALGMLRLPARLLLGALVALALAALVLWLARGRLRRLARWAGKHRRLLGISLAVLLVAVAAWAYVVRPLGSDALGPYEAHNRQSLVRLGWYTAPPVVPLAVGGLALALVAGGPGLLLIATLALLEGVLQLSDARITPLHFWAGRRLVPILAPAAALFAALALSYVWPSARTFGQRMAKREDTPCDGAGAADGQREDLPARWQAGWSIAWPRAAVVVVILAWIGWFEASAARPFIGHIEYAGAREDLAALAALVPADGIVLYEWGDESWRLTLPLQMQLNVRGFLVPPDALSDARLPALLRHMAAAPVPGSAQSPRAEAARAGAPAAGFASADGAGRAVYWLSVGGSLDWLPPGFRAERVATRVLNWPEAQRSPDRLPWRVERYVAVIDLYRITLAPGSERVPGPVLDVGGADGCCLGSGFGPSTQVAGCAACRWITGHAVLDVPAPDGGGQRELVLALTAGPEQQEERWAEVWAQGALLGRVPLGRGFRTYYLPLDGVAGRTVRVELRPSGGPLAVDWARVDLVWAGNAFLSK